ncbi:MAG: 3-deoxy-D-manno-octulosonic acid transferase [Thermodesulfobacteriota bacterium]|nr:3-deoxy-D-manno-octulosonic acid transferase [Thermodesulfobacteriota bacterium]
MLMFLYDFLWTLVLFLCIPLVPLIGKRRSLERLALILPAASLGNGNIWIHALSVGEVISALPLVKSLADKYPDRGVVFSVTTSKGMAIAQKELEGKVEAILTMPLDFWWCVRRMVNYVRPAVFILIETDIWPGVLDYMRKKGIRSILVNGRVSPRTLRCYLRFPLLTRRAFEPFDICLMQSKLDRERLLDVGIRPPEKVVVSGNIKFDRDWAPMNEEERRGNLSALGFEPEDLIWVAGSTHQGEEEVLIEVFKRLCLTFPRLRLILAPRDIERSGVILDMAQKAGFMTILRSELSAIGAGNYRSAYDILILDTLGELGRIYGLGKVSFVGGSLVPIGGHNLLEPASFGCPVVFGPHTHNFVVMAESLEEAGGGSRVQNGDELFDVMKMLLGDADKRTRMGSLAKRFVENNRGALERVVSHI